MPFFTNALPPSLFSSTSFPSLTPFFFPSIFFVSNSRNCKIFCKKFIPLNLTATKGRSFMFLSSKGMYCDCSGILRRCNGLDSDCPDGDFALEEKILEFMKSSKNPESFPSKKDLVDAGRLDLVEAVLKKGGWLSLGWNLDDEADEGNSFDVWESESFGEFSNSSPSSSSSLIGRSLEMVAEDVSGIEGMLSRLEKERNENFGVGFPSSVGKNDLRSETTAKETAVDLQGSTIMTSVCAEEGKWNDLGVNLSQNSSSSGINGFRDSISPKVRGTWSTYRGEFQYGDFQDFEIDSSKGRSGGPLDVSRNGTLGSRGDYIKSNSGQEEINLSQVQNHIQHLELELSSMMDSLRSSNTFVTEKGQSVSSDDLLKLSDAWEFQENEILKTRDELRSIRAKLAIAEGKMALKFINAQKTIDEKQKRINSASRALQMLRTAYVNWPTSASEVLLVGSFDGWASQRKMEKSSEGVFSLSLKLYPGNYEIKFIVDGQWKVDPLRTIVNSSGYENNLLIVT